MSTFSYFTVERLEAAADRETEQDKFQYNPHEIRLDAPDPDKPYSSPGQVFITDLSHDLPYTEFSHLDEQKFAVDHCERYKPIHSQRYCQTGQSFMNSVRHAKNITEQPVGLNLDERDKVIFDIAVNQYNNQQAQLYELTQRLQFQYQNQNQEIGQLIRAIFELKSQDVCANLNVIQRVEETNLDCSLHSLSQRIKHIESMIHGGFNQPPRQQIRAKTNNPTNDFIAVSTKRSTEDGNRINQLSELTSLLDQYLLSLRKQYHILSAQDNERLSPSSSVSSGSSTSQPCLVYSHMLQPKNKPPELAHLTGGNRVTPKNC